MKKGIFFTVIVFISCISFAQNNPRPTKSRFWNNNKSTFLLKPGDILVYEIEDSASKSPLLVTIKKFAEEIAFDFELPQKKQKGSFAIDKQGVNSAVVYQALHNNSNTVLQSGANLFWLSKDNYRSLASEEKSAQMDFGNGQERFVRQSASTQKINFKGKEKIVTIYKVGSETGLAPSFAVLTDLSNPLIVNMKGEINITLKEVR